MNPAAPVDGVGAGVLQNILLTNPGFPNPSGYTTNSIDISGLAGQTVRLRFAEVDNQFFFTMGIDNVHLSAGTLTLPTSQPWALFLSVIALTMAGLFYARKFTAPS